MRYAVAILFALTMPASAEIYSANSILPGCKAIVADHPATFDMGRCAGFVHALFFAVDGRHFCWPQGVTIGQAVAVVVKYIEARPERMHEHFGMLAIEAMREAWPCKR
jgi:hypothetical protein